MYKTKGVGVSANSDYDQAMISGFSNLSFVREYIIE